MLSEVTDNVSEYVKRRGINIAKMSRDTNIPYCALYSSLMDVDRKRDLRDGEFMKVCFFLGVDPREFASEIEKEVKT